MANGFNEASFLGNIGKKETKVMPNGTPKTTFSLAVNERRKVQGEWTDVCTWVPLVLWGSENLLNFLEVGKQVFVKARYETRSWDDKDGQKKYSHEFNVSDIRLLGSKPAETADSPAPRRRSAAPSKPISEDLGISDDDVPF
jgi:single-strand DNA-binding protein